MTQEEKAKAYDKAIEKIKYVMEHGVSPVLNKEDLQDIFPELKESEDERIRKELLESFKYQQRESRTDKEWLNGIKLSEVVAWLERQGDTNETIDRDEFAKGVLRGAAINLITWIDYNAAEGNMCLSNMECKDIQDALVRGDWNKIYAYMKKKLERQDEEKPIFNVVDWQPSKVDGKIHNIYNSGVEPKFKVGDWIIFNENHNSIYQVEKIDKYRYYLRHYLGGTLSLHFDNELIRQWTIQDADEGDVLVDKSDGTIGIFQSIGHHPDGGSFNDPSYCFLHCRYDDGYFYADFENGNTMDSYDVIPATKEQRNLLFSKMRDAGYEWDENKKELKKMEQKQKWTKEDVIRLDRICKTLWKNRKGDTDEIFQQEQDVEWLRTLKDRVEE